MSRPTTSSTACKDGLFSSYQAVEEAPQDFGGFAQQLNEALNINFSLNPHEIKELKQEWSKTSGAIRKSTPTVIRNRPGNGTLGRQKKPTG